MGSNNFNNSIYDVINENEFKIVIVKQILESIFTNV